MNRYERGTCAILLLAAAALLVPPRVEAQTKDDTKPERGHDRKYVVRLLTIEDGDTTFTDHAVGPDDREISWVDEDGTELTAVFEAEDDDDDADMREDMTEEVLGKEKYREYLLESGKSGKPMKIFVRKAHGGGHEGMSCCNGDACCMMEMKGMHGKMDDKMVPMHGKMDGKMMRMHGKMDEKMHDKKERMHEKMEKKMMRKEKDSDDDHDSDDDADDDSEDDDDDGANLP